MDEIDLRTAAMRGTAILHEITRRTKIREEILLKKLVASCEAQNLGNDQMRDSIAGIAALRGLIRDIERDVKVATEESRQSTAEGEE